MSWICLVRNPTGKGLLCINDGEEIVEYETLTAAKENLADHPLVDAWGGIFIDLDEAHD